MARSGLLRLPNELLLGIFEGCDLVLSVFQLSLVNHRFRKIFTDHYDSIIARVVRNHVPAHEVAISLAKKEVTFIRARVFQGEVRPVSWVSILERNADFSSRIVTGFQQWISEITATWTGDLDLELTCLHELYYFLRELALAYEGPGLLRALRTRAETMPWRTLRTLIEVARYMASSVDEEDVELIGMGKNRKYWTPEDELLLIVLNDEWEFALCGSSLWEDTVWWQSRKGPEGTVRSA